MTVDWDSFSNNTMTAAEVRLLGKVDVNSMLALQKLMVHDVRQQNQVSASVMLCEHPPVITTGTDSSLLELPVDRRELDSRLLDVHKLKRDGHAILHQPGQLCVYVVVSLDECGFGEAEFRWRLQQAVINMASECQVMTHRKAGDHNAVWGRHGLIAELGIHVNEGVTSFGFFLNVSNRLDEARTIGRGLLGDRVSSLNAERVRPSIPSQVRSSLIQSICEQIGYPEYHIHTGHPFLARTRKFVHDKFADH